MIGAQEIELKFSFPDLADLALVGAKPSIQIQLRILFAPSVSRQEISKISS